MPSASWPRRAAASLLLAVVAGAQVPSPAQFLGYEVGADERLCNFTDLMRYFRAVAAATDRVRLVEIGKTSYGQTMTMAVVTSPANHAKIEQLRAIAQRLCGARDVDATVVEQLAAQGKAIVWIDAGLHATEVIAGQNIIELVWQMASRDDAEVRHILDEVVLLACPVNPDGLELVANAYAATKRTEPPVLYQRYVGHDNNRDFYACNQLETQNVSRVFYRDWCPQIVYNHHQAAPAGTIIFTPPFRDPFNYYADPMVVRGIEVVSGAMNARFAAEGKPGVISRSGAPYSGWWNGGLRSTCYFHNIIGILTESFGKPEPTTITQTLDRRLPNGDYPDPVPTQLWHARQTIEYLQTANFAILGYAARYRHDLLRGIWRMGRNSIERGSRDYWTPTPRLVAAARARADGDTVWSDPMLRDPRVFVLRPDQRDFAAATRLVRTLQRSGVEVLIATAPFVAGGAECPQGSFVIRTDQPFRPHLLDMFEPQYHPDDLRDGKPVPPYDAAGWTLAMQMGVDVVRCLDDLRGPFTRLDSLATFSSQAVATATAGWRLDPANSHAVIAVQRLLRGGVAVERAPGGVFFVPSQDGVRARLAAAIAELGVAAAPLDEPPPGPLVAQRLPRIGLFDVFGGHMATGWDQWVLREFELPVELVFGDRIAAGDLERDYDVLLFHTGLPAGRDLEQVARPRDEDSLARLAAALPPFEDWSTLPGRATRLDAKGTWPALRAFVEHGGTLLALGGECEKVVRAFDLPVRVGSFVRDAAADGGERATRREEFYIPGSLVALDVDRSHPFAAGCRAQPAAMFTNSSPVMAVTGDGAQVVASYRRNDTLVSGWALGEEYLAGKAAVIEAQVGKGRIGLFGAEVTYRGQPVGTFKLLFGAILLAASGG